MKKAHIWAIIIVVAALVLWYVNGGDKKFFKPSDAIRVGSIESLSGITAYYGEQNKKGVDVALEEIRGKYPGTKIEIIHEDSFYTPKGGVTAYERLSALSALDGVITHASHVSLAVQPLAKKDNIPQMAVSASADSYSSPNDLSFRISPTTMPEAKAMAQYMLSKKYKKIAIVYFKTEVGDSVVQAMETLLKDKGIEIGLKDSFAIDAIDFKTLVSKVNNTKPDALYIVGTAANMANILKEAHAQNVKTDFLGFRAAEDPALLKVGILADGVVYTYGFDPVSKNKNVEAFVETFLNKHNSVPDGYAAEGYEGAKVLLTALIECKSERSCVQKHITSIKNQQSVFGSITFDEKGDVDYPFFLKTVRNGEFVKLK